MSFFPGKDPAPGDERAADAIDLMIVPRSVDVGHFAVRLDEDNRTMLYVPEGLAHGFLTLADGTEVSYQMSAEYSPDHGAGVRYDDPAFGVRWPEPVRVIVERDRTYPDFRP